MRRNLVYTPDGVKVSVNLDDPQLAQHVESELIAPYRELIENNWLDSGKKKKLLSMEERIKKYLERLGTLLLQDPGDYVILSDSMQRRIAMRETQLEDYLEDKPTVRCKRVYQKRTTEIPRSQKLRQIQKQFPGCNIHWIPVDTDNVAWVDGAAYQVGHPAYEPVKLAGDIYYPMDCVGVLHCREEEHFFTQALDEIAQDQITCLAIPDCGTERKTEE